MPDEQKGIFDKIWDWFFKSLNWGWNLLLTAAAFFILASWVCWAFKIQCNFFFIGFILAGAWAVKRLSGYFKKAEDIGIRIFYYFALVVGTILFMITWFPKTALNSYVNWAATGYDLKGFILIFAPWVGITILSVALALMSDKALVWSKRWMIFCLVACILGILLYSYVTEPLDKWMKENLIAFGRDLEVSRINKVGTRGIYVKVKADDTSLYLPDPQVEGKFNPCYVDPNKREIVTLEADVLCKLNSTDEREGMDGNFYLNISCDLAVVGNYYIRLRDVVAIAADNIYEDRNCRIFKEGSTWHVEFFTDAPVKLMDNWDKKVIPIYEVDDGLIPLVNAGRGYTTFDEGIGMSAKGRPMIIQWKEGGKITLNICE